MQIHSNKGRAHSMAIKDFKGDQKVPLRSPLANIEKKFIQSNVDKFPPWIEGYHLTLTTLWWSGGTILFGWLAGFASLHFLWLSSLMLFMQWFTDSFDGALGRHRDFGIPKWGFYMDHLLDFVFMGAVIMSYGFLVEPAYTYMLFILGFFYLLLMVNSFLAFAATTEFKITYLGVGPTEVRLIFIILNTIIIFSGSARIVEILTPWALTLTFIGSVFIVARTSKNVWALDMKDKRARDTK